MKLTLLKRLYLSGLSKLTVPHDFASHESFVFRTFFQQIKLFQNAILLIKIKNLRFIRKFALENHFKLGVVYRHIQTFHIVIINQGRNAEILYISSFKQLSDN